VGAAPGHRFVRHQDGPFCMKDRVAGHHGDTPMPLGLMRPFKARGPSLRACTIPQIAPASAGIAAGMHKSCNLCLSKVPPHHLLEAL
jgi:hypothetical protein